MEESERPFRQIIENAKDVIWTMNLDMEITYVSPSVEEFLGYNAEELMSMPIDQIMTPTSSQTAIMNLMEELDAEKTGSKDPGRFKEVEFEYIRKDGSKIWTEARMSFLRDSDGKAIGIMGISRDIIKRKQTEKALHQSEERYRTMIEHSNDMIWTLDTKGNFSYINKKSEEVTGHKSEEAIGKTFEPLILNEDLEKVKDVFKRTLQGRSQNYEVRVHDISGTKIITLSVNTAPIIMDTEVVGTVSFGRDVTERKRAEEALKESEERYRTIFNSTTNGLLVFNAEGRIIDANRAACQMYGYTLKEMVKLSGKDIVHSDYYHLFEGFKQQVTDSGKFHAESVDVRKDGSTFDIDVNGTLFNFRGEPHLLAIIRDITDRKCAEKAIHESEEKYRTLTDHINVGVYRNTAGHEGKFIEANPAIVEMFGYESKKQFIQMSVSDLYQNPVDRASFNEKMIEDGFVIKEELNLKKRDGSCIVCSVSSVAVKDEKGNIQFYDGIIEDITERKRSEEEIISERNRAEFYLDLLSHDIGNIHQGIYSWLQLADSMKDDQNRVMGSVNASEKLVIMSIDLVKNVKLLSNLKSMDLKPEPTDLNDHIRKALGSVEDIFSSKKITVHYKHPGKKIEIMAEPLIRQLFLNLLHNNVKFQNGESAKIEIDVVLSEDGNRVDVTISDHGPGIPDDMKSILFDRMRLSRSKVRIGFGLILVKELVDRYNGNIHVSDRVPGNRSQGSKFVVTFPLLVQDP